MAESPRPVEVTRDLVLGGTTVRVELKLVDAPVPPRYLLPVLRLVADNLIDNATQAALARGSRPSCHAGCSTCCDYLVPIGRAEAHRLREVIDALPEPRRLQTRARFAATRERIVEAGLMGPLQRREPIAELEAFSDTYFAAHIPCPLLEDGLCTIYPERPLACREHVVVSPPARCAGATQGEEEGAGPIVRLELPAFPSVVANAMEDCPTMSDGGFVPLALALDYADRAIEAPPVAHAPVLVERFFAAIERLAGTKEELE